MGVCGNPTSSQPGNEFPGGGGGGGAEPLSLLTDPCAGKKGSLDYDKRRNKPDPNGNWTAREHIKYNHIRTDVETGKSKYTNSIGRFASEKVLFAAVTAINQATFQFATGFEDRGRLVYVYAVPETPRSLGPISVQVTVGTDAGNGFQHTNVNTLVLEKDCKTVVTSYPGTAAAAGPGDIHGTPMWAPVVPTIIPRP
jgi:hypothetical protein